MNNKILKWVLIGFNSLMLLWAIKWYLESYEIEPKICIVGQITILFTIILEKKFPNIKNIKNEDSEIETNISSDSDVEVLNKKNKRSKITTKIR